MRRVRSGHHLQRFPPTALTQPWAAKKCFHASLAQPTHSRPCRVSRPPCPCNHLCSKTPVLSSRASVFSCRPPPPAQQDASPQQLGACCWGVAWLEHGSARRHLLATNPGLAGAPCYHAWLAALSQQFEAITAPKKLEAGKPHVVGDRVHAACETGGCYAGLVQAEQPCCSVGSGREGAASSMPPQWLLLPPASHPCIRPPAAPLQSTAAALLAAALTACAHAMRLLYELQYELALSLEEIFSGCTKQVGSRRSAGRQQHAPADPPSAAAPASPPTCPHAPQAVRSAAPHGSTTCSAPPPPSHGAGGPHQAAHHQPRRGAA